MEGADQTKPEKEDDNIMIWAGAAAFWAFALIIYVVWHNSKT